MIVEIPNLLAERLMNLLVEVEQESLECAAEMLVDCEPEAEEEFRAKARDARDVLSILQGAK